MEKEFQIYPAIDMIGGQCVRLTQGRYDDVTVYHQNPAAVAKDFKEKGATHIHMVDLDGAKKGSRVNHPFVLQVKEETGLFVEIGGGIRSLEDIAFYSEAGIDRIILGTSALRDPELLQAAAKSYGQKIAVGIDAKDGYVAVAGWEEKSNRSAFDFAKEVEAMGVSTIIYTDIACDGMLAGPNLEAMAKMAQTVAIPVIASGGIGSLEDVENLKTTGVAGAIVGKAIYAGKIDVEKLFK